MTKEEKLEKVSLQFISHFTEKYSYIDSIRLVLEGNCKWVQLRMKDATVNELRENALVAKKLCAEHNAVFIIDDNVTLVKEVGADGVHLGRNDMPVDEARKILGDSFIIGGTANTYEDVRRLVAQGADYIGCGPFRFTQTKKNLSPILGADGYRQIVSRMKMDGLQVPIVAIGGITIADITTVMQTGVSGIAVSGAVLRAEQPNVEIQKFNSEIKKNSVI